MAIINFWRTPYRSGGVRVSRPAYQRIRAGDQARNLGQWEEAAEHYRGALEIEPDLPHIRIQMGHALKEGGNLREAEDAYRSARQLDPLSRDASLHLAHLLKLRGDLDAAAECYAELVLRDASDREAMREARETIALSGTRRSRAVAAALLAHIGGSTPEEDAPHESEAHGDRIAYDVTDLIDFSSRFRRPTGIQRVQAEVLLRVLDTTGPSRRSELCYYAPALGGWVAIPCRLFCRFARLALAGDGAESEQWERTRDELHLRLLVGCRAVLCEGTTLVNLGSSWSLSNYPLHLREARRRWHIRYVPMVYDLIPLLMPDAFTDSLVREFVSWITTVFDDADAFLAISEATKRDLIVAADTLGVALNPDLVTVIPLDAAFNDGSAHHGGSGPPRGPTSKPYVLFVATLEPRKGHLVAFEAWKRLIDRLGANRVPTLVCVGRDGWRNEPIFGALSANPSLNAAVCVMHDVSDDDLADLYRHSLFTIYPSLYEGWGLPVTEALCHGKMVVTTTASSLPEAGGAFAWYVPPGDGEALATAAEKLILELSVRQALEAKITAGFRPRSWRAVGEQIAAAARSLGATQPLADEAWSRLDPTARPGTFYWFGTSQAMTLRVQDDRGDVFRSGLAWCPPEAEGCRPLPDGGGALVCLRDGRALPIANRTVVVRLIGSSAACDFTIEGSVLPISGRLTRGERLSVKLALADSMAARIQFTIFATPVEPHLLQGTAIEPPLIEGFCLR